MIVYEATARDFRRDVQLNRIEDRVVEAFGARLGHGTSRNEIAAWRNSLRFMESALALADTPEEANVAIEYRVPLTSKRVDFILSGADDESRDTAVIVELKQWSEVEMTEKDAIVRTFVGGGVREQTHPSYQAWTYAALIRDYNAAVQDGDIRLAPCAYLHNCSTGAAINDRRYIEHLEKAPCFLKHDVEQLAAFLARHVCRADQGRVLYRMDHGRLRPSKSLADELVSLMRGNREFKLIDDQKIVYEMALSLAADAGRKGRRQVLIVRGGPGTGKSVVAINLLVELTRRELIAQYVSRNAAPRAVYAAKLTGTMTKTRIANLFRGSGAFVGAPAKGIDALIVDEAHRLNEKSGLYGNLGDNQICELVLASSFSVFFVDDDQRVTLKDIGESGEIRRLATDLGADVHELELASQFRCNGSDGYLAWLDHVLQIRDTANPTLDGIDYDFRVYDSPNALHDEIIRCNTARNRARMVAGYCWDWKGKNDPSVKDVVYPEHDYAARWNLDKDGSLWIMQPDSVSEIGCIHTCQGLEVDQVGVFIGPDLLVRNGRVMTDALAHPSRDRTLYGYRTWAKKKPEAARSAADRVIRNTYRTLMSRGMRGCAVFSDDAETRDWFRSALSEASRN